MTASLNISAPPAAPVRAGLPRFSSAAVTAPVTSRRFTTRDGAQPSRPATADRPAAPSLHDMHGIAPNGRDTTWAFNLQLGAVLLLVLGQVVEALNLWGALPLGGAALWLHDCLFPIQLPLLFFCLGYLYQRYYHVRTAQDWALNIRRAAVVLLVPFAVFTVLYLAADSVAGAGRPLTPENLVSALILRPVEPLGYLYTAFLLVAITPTVKSRRNAWGLVSVAAAAKLAIVALLTLPATASGTAGLPALVTSVAENWVWMAAGMAMALLRGITLLRSPQKAWALGALWIAGSVITFMAGWIGEASHAVLDAIGILWFASLFATVFRAGHQDGAFAVGTTYTMALFLMSGFFLRLAGGVLAAAGLLGSTAPALCALVALVAALALPPLVQMGLEKLGRIDMAVYPARYLPPAEAILKDGPIAI